MCKIGTSKWTKKQTTAKTEKAELLDAVASGEVEASNLTNLLADIETRRVTMDEDDKPTGYESEEAVMSTK